MDGINQSFQFNLLDVTARVQQKFFSFKIEDFTLTLRGRTERK